MCRSGWSYINTRRVPTPNRRGQNKYHEYTLVSVCVCHYHPSLAPEREANPDPIALSSYFPFLMETQNRWILKE
jgi:hypothetical protein